MQTQTRFEQKRRLPRAQTRPATRYGVVFSMVVLLALPRMAAAAEQGVPMQIAALLGAITALQNTVNALQTTVTNQAAQLAALQAKTQFVSVSNGEMFITGTNLHIRNGSGATNGNPADPFNQSSSNINVDGKGNLIVGYNASRTAFSGMDVRTGSHNLIIGDANNYTRFGGIVAGLFNTSSGDYASVSGGLGNQASAAAASVSGGLSNIASAAGASVSGGQQNTAAAAGASVSGGSQNTASAAGASVSGGLSNTASGTLASVSGGKAITEPNLDGWSAGGDGAAVFHAP